MPNRGKILQRDFILRRNGKKFMSPHFHALGETTSPNVAMAGSEMIEPSAGDATLTTATTMVGSSSAMSNVHGSESGKAQITDASTSTRTHSNSTSQGPHPYNQYQQLPNTRSITPPLVGSAMAPTANTHVFAPSAQIMSSTLAAPQEVTSQGVTVTAPTLLPLPLHGPAAQPIAAHNHLAISLAARNQILPATQVAGPHNLVPVHLQHLLLGPTGAPAIQGHYGGGMVPAPSYRHNLIPLQLQASAAAAPQVQQPLAALQLQQLQPALVTLDPSQQSLLAAGLASTAAPPLSLLLGTQPPPTPSLRSALLAQQLLGPLPQAPPVPVPGSEHGMPTGPALCIQDLIPAITPVFNGVNPNYPGLRVVNSDPPVFAVDNFVSTEECAFLISSACDCFGPAPVVGAGAGEISPSRTSSTCYLAREDLPEYLRKVSVLTGKPVRHCELPQVGRYLPSQQYLQHFDAFDLSTEDGRRFASNGGQRTVTVLVYLNDVDVGGATSFPALGLDVQPRKGTALIFFPATVNGYLDKRALHAALPAVDVKYVSQVWIRQGDYDGLPSKRLGRDRDAAVREAARLNGVTGV
uniref:Fe2OG dioxygenase domain-containing protein n=1 Tax=Odontella aurita TaxID=265563 RepID=A0A7S4MXQ9_9STRA|mmetsp:Transcript_38897/g.116998  ORF Transcript_38897/g.116998 Transcript_38897/m.116998 type:complete len:580 (+) Transcript_38897:111-1850(+)